MALTLKNLKNDFFLKSALAAGSTGGMAAALHPRI
jgi:hypothetical protein